MIPRKWTPERVALFRAELPDNTDPPALLARLNALPGEPITTLAAMSLYAIKKGLRRNPEASLAILREAGRAGVAKRLRMSGGRIITVWTAERDARLTEGRVAGEAQEATLAALNAMPGVPVASLKAMRERAKKIKARAIRRPPAPRPKPEPRVRKAAPPRVAAEPEPPPVVQEPEPDAPPLNAEGQAAIADAAMLSRQDRVRAGLREAMGKRGVDVSASATALSVRHKMPLREVMRLMGEVRNEGAAA